MRLMFTSYRARIATCLSRTSICARCSASPFDVRMRTARSGRCAAVSATPIPLCMSCDERRPAWDWLTLAPDAAAARTMCLLGV